jgi:hypothetical protein
MTVVGNESVDLAGAGGVEATLRHIAVRNALAVDTGDVDLLLTTYHSDGRLAVYQGADATEASMVKTGHAELGTSPTDLRRKYLATHHQLGQSDYTIDGATATGYVYCTARHVMVGDGGLVDLVLPIRYIDKYEQRDGVWRLITRDVIVLWRETCPVDAAVPPPLTEAAAR